MSDSCLTWRVIGTAVSREIQIVAPTDFQLEPDLATDAPTLLRDPAYSLYCFDPERNGVLFVRCGDWQTLESPPFYYQAQRARATHLALVPMDTFFRLSKTLPDPGDRLIWVHSVGRCGSTLMSKLLAADPQVLSLSEPDDLTQLLVLRHDHSGHEDAWLAEILPAALRWRCRPSGRGETAWAIKTRSEVIDMWSSLATLFPSARTLFLYRNAVEWMRTIFSGFRLDHDLDDQAFNREMKEGWARYFPLLAEFGSSDRPLNPVQIRTLCWIASVEAYLHLVAAGAPTCALRFEDLTTRPLDLLPRVFELLGLQLPEQAILEDILSRDSQAGTTYSQEQRRKTRRPLTEPLISEVLELVQSRPLIRAPDAVLPNTILPPDC